ncbi:NAD(P)H-binding protein [Lysobacter sp. A6]|uniref:NAD(P)H-binding protein n=1 Tax=Noviluteimonas lactosilytica TaxID=2888523 RepID=A0ABS8JJQ2_9GAMM|nr:NAD(P)H-binding protein [Lysobacter lactosilyticus]
MKLLVLGSTGLVGRHVLAQALAHPHVDKVIAPVRRPIEAQPKLFAPVVDFDALPADAPWWQADAVICALGTTMRIAGSEDAFRRVDHDYPLAAAQLAHAHGTPTYVLNSSTNADRNARVFYLRVKGETEHDIAQVGFRSLTLVRPGLIEGDRDEFRAGERIGIAVLRAFGGVVPKRWRTNPADRIAATMLDAALDPQAGVHVIGSERMTR